MKSSSSNYKREIKEDSFRGRKKEGRRKTIFKEKRKKADNESLRVRCTVQSTTFVASPTKHETPPKLLVAPVSGVDIKKKQETL